MKMLIDDNQHAVDAEDARIKAEAMPLAERLRDLLLGMNYSSNRSDVLAVLTDALCIKCGDKGATHACYCDYSTPLD
jgi:hypothetical protein